MPWKKAKHVMPPLRKHFSLHMGKEERRYYYSTAAPLGQRATAVDYVKNLSKSGANRLR